MQNPFSDDVGRRLLIYYIYTIYIYIYYNYICTYNIYWEYLGIIMGICRIPINLYGMSEF